MASSQAQRQRPLRTRAGPSSLAQLRYPYLTLQSSDRQQHSTGCDDTTDSRPGTTCARGPCVTADRCPDGHSLVDYGYCTRQFRQFPGTCEARGYRPLPLSTPHSADSTPLSPAIRYQIDPAVDQTTTIHWTRTPVRVLAGVCVAGWGDGLGVLEECLFLFSCLFFFLLFPRLCGVPFGGCHQRGQPSGKTRETRAAAALRPVWSCFSGFVP